MYHADAAIDAILALRFLSELYREFSPPLRVVYIVIKSAFDSVDCSVLWKALRSTGAPPFLIHFIQDLHLGSKSRVRINTRLSDPFKTTSGVGQGCVLAAALLCIAIDWIMSRCAQTMGITVASTTFPDQDYADGAVLFTDDPSRWTQIRTRFDVACQTVRLHTSWPKTRL